MQIDNSFWLNEVRIPLESVHDVRVDTCSFSGLSTNHKRSIEIQLWAKFGRVSLFNGNALYSINTHNSAQDGFIDFLRKDIKSFSEENVMQTTLSSVPERILERIIFLLVSISGRRAGYFKLDNGRLFKLPDKAEKKGFATVNLRILIEAGFIKIYFVPSVAVLFNIEDTNREKVFDLELIKFCKFRNTCSVMESKNCKYAFPENIGFYIQQSHFKDLSEKQREDLQSFYKACPQFNASGDQNLIWVKLTKKSSLEKAYPTYLLSTLANDLDLQVEGIASSYRDQTLLPSHKRYDRTKLAINAILGKGNYLEINDLRIPIDNLFAQQGSPNANTNHIGYKSKVLHTSNITSNPNFPNGSQISGGWQFQNYGSLDRSDSKRPFKKIEPLIIAPDNIESRKLVKQLLGFFDKGYPKKENPLYTDYQFDGLNTEISKGKFNVEFAQPEPNQFYFCSEQDYLPTALKLRKLFLSQEENPNLIVLAVLPENRSSDGEHPLYFKLKKIFIEDGIPTQFISYEKLKGINDPTVSFGSVLWNLFLDIYVKLGGKPWKLTQAVSNVNCFIGVGFAINPRTSQNHIYAGVANVFDRYGNWLDITSNYQDITDEERNEFFERFHFSEGTNSFKISKEVTDRIVKDSLELYSITQNRQGTYPKNIVFHKLGEIYQCEIDGFLDAISSLIGTFGGARIGIASIHSHHLLRLYGTAIEVNGKPTKASRVISRGTMTNLAPNKDLLATTGRVFRKDFLSYFGIGTPRPLIIEGITPNEDLLNKYKIDKKQFYSQDELTSHIYALTQLHWGSLREDIRYPITVLYAKKVADIISKTENLIINHRMTIKRPWFV